MVTFMFLLSTSTLQQVHSQKCPCIEGRAYQTTLFRLPPSHKAMADKSADLPEAENPRVFCKKTVIRLPRSELPAVK